MIISVNIVFYREKEIQNRINQLNYSNFKCFYSRWIYPQRLEENGAANTGMHI